MRKEEQWKEECVEERKIPRVGAEKIEDKKEKQQLIQRKRENSEYWLKAAQNLLDSDTPQAAIVIGYYAAKDKAEEALAQENYKINDHGCAYKGVSRVLEQKDLGTKLKRMYQIRKDINYDTKLGENSDKARKFIEDRVKPFIQKIDEKKVNS